MFRLISAAVILATTFTAGCAEDDLPTTPVDPPVAVSETFTGAITINGAATHVFSTERAGEAVATLSSLSPDSAAIVSFTFGTWNGQFCQVILAKDDATSGTRLIGTASAGAFCVRVSDVGRLASPTEYSITVDHF